MDGCRGVPDGWPAISDQKHTAEMIGLHNTFNVLGSVLGPAIGAFLYARFGHRMTVAISSLTFLGAIILIYLAVPRLKYQSENRKTLTTSAFIEIYRTGLYPAFLLVMSDMIVLRSYLTFFPLLMRRNAMTLSQIGILMSIEAAMWLSFSRGKEGQIMNRLPLA
jgi:predicted MFS family arabinose efflux permease